MSSVPAVLSKELEVSLQREIMYQSWTAEWAWRHLEEALEPPPIVREMAKNPEAHKGPMKISDPLPQALLNHAVIAWGLTRVMLSGASIVSRILWPLTRKRPENAREKYAVGRSQELRRRWKLPPDSYLSNRDVRDVFEHVDEKLEEWIDTHPDRPAAGLKIGAVADNPEFRKTCFRLLDPTTKVVYAGDKQCDLAKVFAALEDVANRLPPIGFPVEVGIPKGWRADGPD